MPAATAEFANNTSSLPRNGFQIRQSREKSLQNPLSPAAANVPQQAAPGAI